MFLKSKKLGDICEFVNGGTPDTKVRKYFEGKIPWITSADINGQMVTKARSFITEEAISNSATNLIPKGTILLVTRTGVGKVAITGMDLCISQDLTGIFPQSEKLDTNFLAHFLRSKKPYFVSYQRGATIKGITREVVENLSIPLPPLEDQRRIAAILDKADAIRRKRQEAIKLTDELLRSVFLEMFGDPVTNPKGWEKQILGDIVERIVVGHVGPTSHAYCESGVQFLRTQNVRRLKINRKDIQFITDEFHKKLKKSTLRTGDVLISRVGANRGMAAVVPEDLDGVNCANIIIISCGSYLKPEFLAFLVNSSSGQASLMRESVGSAQGVINVETVKKWEILVPSFKVQEKFAWIVKKIIENEEKQINSLLAQENLFNSLVQRAFRGDL
ncbi:MAG: restriction endonuclease subunit S [Blastocatellia bacterium]|nr:restriction endonuclease subunit S [Blastocatellia bacterium]